MGGFCARDFGHPLAREGSCRAIAGRSIYSSLQCLCFFLGVVSFVVQWFCWAPAKLTTPFSLSLLTLRPALLYSAPPMAGASGNSSDGVQSWPGFFAELVKSFLLLRDIFGYALPGAVFLGIGVISHRISFQQLSDLLQPYEMPGWMALIFVLGACYVTGQILAAIAYLPIDLWKWLSWRSFIRWHRHNRDKTISEWYSSHPKKKYWLGDHPTEVTGDLLEIQRRYPSFAFDLGRRETMALFLGATLAALIAGPIVFCYTCLRAATLFVIAGLLLIIAYSTAISHLRRVRSAVRDATALALAAEAAKQNPPPDDLKQVIAELAKTCTAFLNRL